LIETTAKRFRRAGNLVYLDFVSANPLHRGMSLVIDPTNPHPSIEIVIRAIALQSIRILNQ